MSAGRTACRAPPAIARALALRVTASAGCNAGQRAPCTVLNPSLVPSLSPTCSLSRSRPRFLPSALAGRGLGSYSAAYQVQPGYVPPSPPPPSPDSSSSSTGVIIGAAAGGGAAVIGGWRCTALRGLPPLLAQSLRCSCLPRYLPTAPASCTACGCPPLARVTGRAARRVPCSLAEAFLETGPYALPRPPCPPPRAAVLLLLLWCWCVRKKRRNAKNSPRLSDSEKGELDSKALTSSGGAPSCCSLLTRILFSCFPFADVSPLLSAAAQPCGHRMRGNACAEAEAAARMRRQRHCCHEVVRR